MTDIQNRFPALINNAFVTIDYYKKIGRESTPTSVQAIIQDVGEAMILIDRKPTRIRITDIINAAPQKTRLNASPATLKNGLEHLVYNQMVDVKFTIDSITDVIPLRGLVCAITETDVSIQSKDFTQPVKLSLKNIKKVSRAPQ